MNDQNDEDSDHSEVVRLMREARDKSRGYSEYWEWKLDKRQAELHAAHVIANYLLLNSHQEEGKVSLNIVERDPPDALMIMADGRRIGIEITELVDEKAIKRAHRSKRERLSLDFDCAHWDSDRTRQFLVAQITAKDNKLAAVAAAYDELLLVVVTDETMIDEPTAAAAVSNISVSTCFLDRAFLVLSYHPAADTLIFPDGCPVFPIELI
jgi:hypothetical protein